MSSINGVSSSASGLASAAAAVVAAEAAADSPTKVMPGCSALTRQLAHHRFLPQGSILRVLHHPFVSEGMSFIVHENASYADIKAAVQEKTGLTTSVVDAVIMPFFEFLSCHSVIHHVVSNLSPTVHIALPLPEWIPSIHITIPMEEALYSPYPCITLSTPSTAQVQMVSIMKEVPYANVWVIQKIQAESYTPECMTHNVVLDRKRRCAELLILTGAGEALLVRIQDICIKLFDSRFIEHTMTAAMTAARVNHVHGWLESNSEFVMDYASFYREIDMNQRKILYSIPEMQLQIDRFQQEIAKIREKQSYNQKALQWFSGESTGEDNTEKRIETFEKEIADYQEKINACFNALVAAKGTLTIEGEIAYYEAEMARIEEEEKQTNESLSSGEGITNSQKIEIHKQQQALQKQKQGYQEKIKACYAALKSLAQFQRTIDDMYERDKAAAATTAP